MNAKNSKLESFIFADLIVTVIFAVLAYGTVEPWSLALFELNALLVAVLLAVRFTFDSQAKFGGWRMALPLLVLTGWGAIQSVVPALSFDHQATTETTVKLLAMAIYFIAALHTLRSSERRRKVLITLTIFGFAVSLFAIIQRLTYNGKMYWVRPVSPYIAPYGPFGNYNHFAGMIELILPLPFAYLLFTRIKLEQRLLWLFSVVMMAVSVVFSLSRGGILALGIEVLALMLVAVLARKWNHDAAERRAMADNKLIVGVALTAILLLAFWIGYEPLVNRLGTLRQGSGDYSLVSRTEYWSGAWQMFSDYPLTGVGLGAFPAVYPAYGRSSVKNERLEQSHNDYLQLLTDAGLIGALIGLWFLFELIRVTRRQFQQLARARSHERALVVGGYVALLGIAVHSFLDFNLQIAANALLFLLVVALT
ncbi:MAG: O-antigen ligase family protein, partial [Blastocatellia bacterium]